MKFLHFREDALYTQTHATKRWWIVSLQGGVVLGEIKWHAPWRRYCFFPAETTIFDLTCLNEVTKFIDERMKERKK